MNAMLTDEVLEELLTEAAETFEVPAFELPEVAPPKKVWRRPSTQLGAAAAVLVGALLVIQLPGGGRSAVNNAARTPSELKSTSNFGAPGLAPGAPVPLPAAIAPGTVPQTVQHRPAAALTGGGVASSANGVAQNAPTDAIADTARVVKTATVALLVDRGRVHNAVLALQGIAVGSRYIADSNENSGDNPTATVTIRVPVQQFGDVVRGVEAIGKTVSATLNGKDITSTYADAVAQIQSLKAARSRYLAILAGAKTIAETLTVQQRIDDVQSQIDQLETQRRVLADQSDMATITVSVAEKGSDRPLVTAPRTGWSKAWHDATHGFVGGVQALVARSGRTLLVLLVAIAVFWIGRVGWRVARRRFV